MASTTSNAPWEALGKTRAPTVQTREHLRIAKPHAARTPVKSPVLNQAELAPVVSRLVKIGLAGVFTDRHLQHYASMHDYFAAFPTIATAKQSSTRLSSQYQDSQGTIFVGTTSPSK